MSKTVLIVDDDKGIRRLLSDAFTAEGFHAIAEKDGEWALKTFASREIDAIVLDVLIPVLNGFQVAERIRASPKGREIPLVFISGVYASDSHADDARKKHGALAYFDKPLHLGTLVDTVRAALEGADREESDSHRIAVEDHPNDRFASEDAHEEARDVERQEDRFRGAQITRGNFAEQPFPEVLAELYRWRASGALLLRREKVKKIVYFKEGTPIFLKSNLLAECLGKVMVREKMISESECDESLRRMKVTGRQQGTVLVEMGAISPHNLVYALELQLRTKLYDLFRWPDGDFQFDPRAEVPSEPTALGQSVAAVIYEGVRSSYGLPGVREKIEAIEDRYAFHAVEPLLRLQDAGLDEEEMMLLGEIDGTKTVKQLAARGILSDEQAHALLYAMSAARVIELKKVPAKTRKLRPPPPPVSAAAKPPDRRKSPPPPPLSTTELPPDDRELRERLAAQVTAMKRMNYFELLGVTKTAFAPEIHQAFFTLAKEYHPDKHFGSASAEVRGLAAEIFAMLQRARDTLTDEEERPRYIEELVAGGAPRREVSDEVSRILAAEGKFQRGEEFLRKKYFREAVTAFQEAVELYAEEGEFHAFLGWSLFQTDPNDPKVVEAALDHIENAVRLNPKVDKSYLFLGYIQKSIGRPDKAEKQFEKAIQSNPDCTEALRELRILGRERG